MIYTLTQRNPYRPSSILTDRGNPRYGIVTCVEMRAWLLEHPEVTRYAVVDDEDDGLDDMPLFQPSGKTGLTCEIAEGVRRYLAGETDDTMRDNVLVRLGQNVHSLFKRDKS